MIMKSINYVCPVDREMALAQCDLRVCVASLGLLLSHTIICTNTFFGFVVPTDPHKFHKHERDDDSSKKKEDEEVPDWKKKALASGNNDPTAAPFGGNWTSESIVDASTVVTKMVE
jgi:hypothetical protein